MLQESVLRTGIIPIPTWGSNDNVTILSALYSNMETVTPFRIPVIINDKTSDMSIEYKNVKIKPSNSMPLIKNKKIKPYEYANQVCKGFKEAYLLYLKEEEYIDELIMPIWDYKTRFLLRHTQQYNMYLAASLSPVFLRNFKERLMMLQVLQKERKEKKIVKQEIEDIYQLDIPLFEIRGKEYSNYFKTSAYKCFTERKKHINKVDLERQINFIEFSLEVDKINLSKDGNYQKFTVRQLSLYLKNALKKICKYIECNAVIENKDICWMSLYFNRNGSWKFESINFDFYSGLGGISVFLAQMLKMGLLSSDNILKLSIEKLFAYTDNTELTRAKTGLMVGEGSIAFTYLTLFQITGDTLFWSYTEKQALILEQIYEKDLELDFLSGNAGAIYLLIKMYEVSHDKKWLILAKKIGDFLWKKGEKQKKELVLYVSYTRWLWGELHMETADL